MSAAIMDVPVHRRQYIIGPEPIHYRSDWKFIQLSRASVLSHCPSLSVKTMQDADGVSWHLAGIAVQTGRDLPDPADQIAAARTQEVPQKYNTWAGRWILIGNDELHLDASGFLGCYYTRKLAAASGPPWISSSEALLAEILGSKVAGERDCRKLSYRVGIEWFPPPRSQYSAISRLLPSQALRLSDGSIRDRRLFPVLKSISYEEVLERMESLLLTFLRRMPSTNRTTWVTLTGGYDSRVLLAAVAKSGANVKAFTQGYYAIPVSNEEKSRSITLADRLLPALLSKKLGVDHVWVSGGPFDKARAEKFDEHTSQNVVDIQRHFFARDQWKFLSEGDLILGGLCFEVGRCYFWKKLGDSPTASVEAIASGYHEEPNSSLSKAIAEWLVWAGQTPHAGLDWRDRFYIEQRLGGWQSAREQSMDLIPADLLHPMNSHYAHSLSLSVPVQLRQKGQHQVDLVKRMAPELLEIPINPNYDYFPRSTRLYYNWREDSLYPLKWIRQKFLAKS